MNKAEECNSIGMYSPLSRLYLATDVCSRGKAVKLFKSKSEKNCQVRDGIRAQIVGTTATTAQHTIVGKRGLVLII